MRHKNSLVTLLSGFDVRIHTVAVKPGRLASSAAQCGRRIVLCLTLTLESRRRHFLGSKSCTNSHAKLQGCTATFRPHAIQRPAHNLLDLLEDAGTLWIHKGALLLIPKLKLSILLNELNDEYIITEQAFNIVVNSGASMIKRHGRLVTATTMFSVAGESEVGANP